MGSVLLDAFSKLILTSLATWPLHNLQIPEGQYSVTNGEEHFSSLTIEDPDAEGKQSWSLSDDKTLANVTHGPCRSARYTPEGESGTCSPKFADRSAFPLKPGESPPLVSGCNRKNYAVLIVIGVPV